MEFRLANENEITACINLLTDSFFGDPFFQLHCDNDDQRYRFIRAVMKIGCQLSFKHNQLWVGLKDGSIVTCAQLEAPGQKEDTLISYLRHGGFDVIKASGLCNALGWFRMYKETKAVWSKKNDTHWYLMTLAVLNEKRGQGIGTKMLQEGLLPLVAASSCPVLTLITNSQNNLSFYTKNGFILQKHERLTFNGKVLDNWAFAQKV